MAQFIPMTNDGCRRATITTLAGALTFRTYYLPRLSMWFCDIFDASGALLVGGMALVTKLDNLLKGMGDTLYGYTLRVYSQTGAENNTPDSLGGDCQLVLFGPDETIPSIYGG